MRSMDMRSVRSTTGRMLVLLLCMTFALVGIVPGGASAQSSTSSINVELILDASGSMEQRIGGETRMQIAKRVLKRVVAAIPEREGVNVGFRIYGHRGDNTAAGKAVSCRSSDLLVPIDGVDKPAIDRQVEAARSTGWTPLAFSLQRAARDFGPADPGTVDAVVLVTDGLETCGGDPCAAAAAANAGPAAMTTHVVGFALQQQERDILRCVADNGKGLLLGAQDADELTAALFTILEQLDVVSTTGFLEMEAFGDQWPHATATCVGAATDADPEGTPTTVRLDSVNRVEVPVGTCDVTWTNPSGQDSRTTVDIEADRVTWVRGSIIEFPQGAGEVYVVTDPAGVVIWQDQFELGDRVWVLPAIYRIELLERVGDPILVSAEVQTLPGTATTVSAPARHWCIPAAVSRRPSPTARPRLPALTWCASPTAVGLTESSSGSASRRLAEPFIVRAPPSRRCPDTVLGRPSRLERSAPGRHRRVWRSPRAPTFGHTGRDRSDRRRGEGPPAAGCPAARDEPEPATRVPAGRSSPPIPAAGTRRPERHVGRRTSCPSRSHPDHLLPAHGDRRDRHRAGPVPAVADSDVVADVGGRRSAPWGPLRAREQPGRRRASHTDRHRPPVPAWSRSPGWTTVSSGPRHPGPTPAPVATDQRLVVVPDVSGTPRATPSPRLVDSPAGHPVSPSGQAPGPAGQSSGPRHGRAPWSSAATQSTTSSRPVRRSCPVWRVRGPRPTARPTSNRSRCRRCRVDETAARTTPRRRTAARPRDVRSNRRIPAGLVVRSTPSAGTRSPEGPRSTSSCPAVRPHSRAGPVEPVHTDAAGPVRPALRLSHRGRAHPARASAPHPAAGDAPRPSPGGGCAAGEHRRRTTPPWSSVDEDGTSAGFDVEVSRGSPMRSVSTWRSPRSPSTRWSLACGPTAGIWPWAHLVVTEPRTERARLHPAVCLGAGRYRGLAAGRGPSDGGAGLCRVPLARLGMSCGRWLSTGSGPDAEPPGAGRGPSWGWRRIRHASMRCSPARSTPGPRVTSRSTTAIDGGAALEHDVPRAWRRSPLALDPRRR